MTNIAVTYYILFSCREFLQQYARNAFRNMNVGRSVARINLFNISLVGLVMERKEELPHALLELIRQVPT